MPLVNYRANAEAILHEIHEVAGHRTSAKQLLSPSLRTECDGPRKRLPEPGPLMSPLVLAGLVLCAVALLLVLVLYVRLHAFVALLGGIPLADIVGVIEAGDYSEPMTGLVAISIAAGATVLSHVNDSGFWLVGRFLGMDEQQTLRSWTVMETIVGTVGFLVALGISTLL